MQLIDLSAWLLAVALSVPLVIVAVECLLAALRRPRAEPPPADRPPCVVLVPAHDEEGGIGPTLAALAPELEPGDRVLVVADNCTDRTAEVARAAGAWVVERNDPGRRGKGFALAFGVNALRADPPAVVVVLDADCVLALGSLRRLVGRAHAAQRPVQAAYRMTAPPGAGPERRVAEFAFLVKNVARPLGLRRLGLPCLLTGTGMAFPWAVLSRAELGHGHLVEDMQLAVDLTAAGTAPLFAPDAEATAEFPVAAGAATSQRRRWEHGHLTALLAGVPRLLAAAVRRRRVGPLALAAELAVPPLTALLLCTAGALLALGTWTALGGPAGPLAALGSAAGLLSAGLFAVWARYGRAALPPAALARIPFYMLRKVPLYLGFVLRPQRAWVRTPRAAHPTSQ